MDYSKADTEDKNHPRWFYESCGMIVGIMWGDCRNHVT